MFDVKQPCKDCPFRKDADMRHSLGPDRMKEIVSNLLDDDNKTFTCHKTIDYDNRQNKDQEQMCMGSMVFLHKIGRPTISQRLAYAWGHLDPREVEQLRDTVIDEPDI